MVERARLEQSGDEQTVTEETAPNFWFHYQYAILLTLKDNGMLSEGQLQYAEAALREQRRNSTAKMGGESP